MSGSKTTKRRITQDTFDETVRENMEEFELSRAEAVKDAVREFTSQGVDLSNICISYEEGDEDWLKTQIQAPLDALTAAMDNGSLAELPADLDKGAVRASLKTLVAAMTEADCSEKAINARKLLGGQQVLNLLARLWPCIDDEDIVGLSLDLTRALCISGPNTGNEVEEMRDSLWPNSMQKLVEAAKARPENVAFLLKFLSTIKILCTKCEDNKVHFSRYGGLDLLLEILKQHQAERDVVCEACWALRAVTAVDDFRKDFSASHTHTRALVTKGAIPLIINLTRTYSSDLDVVTAALASLRNLANNNESVGQIATQGGLELSTSALETYLSSPAVARTVISVFRNVSADDKYKTSLCNNGGAELMLKAMRKHVEDAKLQEHGLATLGAMALRSPGNALQVVGLGAVPVVLEAMQRHPEHTAIQRQGCLAIRNLVSRNPELVDMFLDAGAEPIVRQAGKYQESVDEAYAALRDLKCEVKKLIVDPTTGQARDAVEQFGSVKTSFRRCYESSHDIDGKINDAITEPSNAFRF